MPTYVLGISAFYHDSAAALVADGEIVAAAQEERFTRVRHDAEFPARAIQYCLEEAGIDVERVDYVSFYDKPLRKFDRLVESYLAYAPKGFASFRQALPVWLKEKLFMGRTIRRGLGGRYAKRIIYTAHHQSHAASAFYASPFDRAAIFTSDGVGEWATTTWGVGEGNKITLRKAISFPHSLGLLYSAFTHFTGFKVNSGEYKMMGLAPYGAPKYVDLIKEKLIDIRPDGSFRLCMEFFTYTTELAMTGAKFGDLFGGPARKPETDITQREMDIAASIQAVTEEIVLAAGRHVHEVTGMKHLVMAGGVALNCVANGRLLREGPFEDIWVQPAAGDAGGALGAALFTWFQLLDKERKCSGRDLQKGSLLGPSYGRAEIQRTLDARAIDYQTVSDERTLLASCVDLLEAGKIIGWFDGRMEFGPRALGSRSILGDARDVAMQTTMNLKIKFRESFRPFAPAVLRERAHEIFEISPEHESPYMLMVANVRPEHRLTLTPEQKQAMYDPDLRKRVVVPRSMYPAVTHVDYSARLQTVDEDRHGRFYRLMKAFEARTGSPVLVNTSFNVRGEPIVNTPEEALNCFLHTKMDALVLGDCLVLKEGIVKKPAKKDTQAYLSHFALD